MVDLKWCLKLNKGIDIVEPSQNMCNSYLSMAEESLYMIEKNAESRIWTASTSYYTMYYSLYALMMKIGIKSDIHSCSIAFMKHMLNEFYESKYVQLIEEAFKLRNNLQYYPGSLIDDKDINHIKEGARDFFVLSKEIISKIREKEIKEIRNKLDKLKYNKD